MKAKHRVLAAGMAAAMTLSLAACGGSASTAEPTATPDRLIRLLQDHPVDGILCGHSHEATLVTEQGLPPQFVGAGAASAALPLIQGRVQFRKQCWIQFCRVQDKRLYWSPLCLDRSKLLANMTPQEMLE